MKKPKSILLLFSFVFIKIISYSMFILAGAILVKQMPNPEPLNFLLNVSLAFAMDFCASLVDDKWKKSMVELYEHN